MKLADLEACFLRRVDHGEGAVYERVDSIAEADGVRFLCPKCYKANGGSQGTHGIICWQPGKVPDDARPGPGRWTFHGTGLADLTLRAKSSSVQLVGGCEWHGFVENGETREA